MALSRSKRRDSMTALPATLISSCSTPACTRRVPSGISRWRGDHVGRWL